MFLVIFYLLQRAEQRGLEHLPPRALQSRGPALPFQSTSKHCLSAAVFHSLGNIPPPSQTVPGPSSWAGKGSVISPDATLPNTEHTHFPRTIPQTPAPTAGTNVITSLTNPLRLFKKLVPSPRWTAENRN